MAGKETTLARRQKKRDPRGFDLIHGSKLESLGGANVENVGWHSHMCEIPKISILFPQKKGDSHQYLIVVDMILIIYHKDSSSRLALSFSCT